MPNLHADDVGHCGWRRHCTGAVKLGVVVGAGPVGHGVDRLAAMDGRAPLPAQPC